MGNQGQQRPGVIRRVLPLVLVAIFAFGITSVIVVPQVRNAALDLVTDLRLKFLPTISDIHPIKTEGAGMPGHGGGLATDNTTGTYWLADPATGDPTLNVTFDKPFNLGGIIVHSGSTVEAEFTKFERPEVLELSFPGTEIDPIRVTLTDVSKDQPIVLDVRRVRTIVIKVISVFAAGDKHVAIREIEFKQRTIDAVVVPTVPPILPTAAPSGG